MINRPVGLVGSAEDKLNQKKTMLGCFRVNLGYQPAETSQGL